ncbi:hypothetical protein [Ruegeria arenilitoris]|uniref:hypothetical protein n=1 Tax=Ruegeria arenilitoris TaxID=1173585 RepID=UPI00147E8EA4|nr:hypothetical protein [Ruegeria arenilitoris]
MGLWTEYPTPKLAYAFLIERQVRNLNEVKALFAGVRQMSKKREFNHHIVFVILEDFRFAEHLNRVGADEHILTRQGYDDTLDIEVGLGRNIQNFSILSMTIPLDLTEHSISVDPQNMRLSVSNEGLWRPSRFSLSRSAN